MSSSNSVFNSQPFPEYSSSFIGEIVLNEVEKSYPLYCLLDKVLRHNKQLKRTLKIINKSILWKMLYPLRFIDDRLREKRMRARLSRRVITAYE